MLKDLACFIKGEGSTFFCLVLVKTLLKELYWILLTLWNKGTLGIFFEESNKTQNKIYLENNVG